MRHILSYISLPIAYHGCHGNQLFKWYQRLKILSYFRVFSGYEARNWYIDHIWAVEAKCMNFGIIIIHYGSKRTCYG